MVSQQVFDRNNNAVSYQVVTRPNGHEAIQITDAVGRKVWLEYVNSYQDDIISSGVGGTELRTIVHWKNIWVCKRYITTHEVLPQNVMREENLLTSLRVVDTITLPAQAGGLTYSFDYAGSATEPTNVTQYTAGWGELQHVKLPTGATAHYAYLNDGQNWQAWEDALANRPTGKTLLYRREEGSLSQTTSQPCQPATENCQTESWVYVITPESSMVVGSDGSVTREYF